MFEKKIDDLEMDLYDVPACYEQAESLLDRAVALFFDEVLEYHNLTYFNPGEPVAENRGGLKDIVVPLTSLQADMLTAEEEERMIRDGNWSLPESLFWARLRIQQAKDVIDGGD